MYINALPFHLDTLSNVLTNVFIFIKLILVVSKYVSVCMFALQMTRWEKFWRFARSILDFCTYISVITLRCHFIIPQMLTICIYKYVTEIQKWIVNALLHSPISLQSNWNGNEIAKCIKRVSHMCYYFTKKTLNKWKCSP